MFSIHVHATHAFEKKQTFFVSARGGQVSQLVQRVCVAAVCATNKRKHVVSDGSIHISSELMLVAQLLGHIALKRDCHFLSGPIYTLRARCLLAWPTLLTKLHPFVGHLCKFHRFAMRQSLPGFGPVRKKSCRSMRALHQSSSNNIRLRFRWWATRRSHELMWQFCHQEPTIASSLKQAMSSVASTCCTSSHER